MRSGEAPQRDRRPRRSRRPAFDLALSKLRWPLIRSGTVPRTSLIERLAQDDSPPIVSVVAPAGYGKTTLLSQWAERNEQAFAWVSLDDGDNDPKLLLTYVAEALDAVEPIDERVFAALGSPTSSVPGSVVPRLGSALSSMSRPIALVLDDVHVLHNRECRAALSVLANHARGGSRLAFAGRDDPPLRVGRLRAEGRILEIGPGDLSLTLVEAAALVRNARVVLGADELAELHRRTEGWPAGLYLAALDLREGAAFAGMAANFGSDAPLLRAYMESESLARISQQEKAFLTRTAVLDRMCGPLCEAVLELPGSRATLTDLVRSNVLLVPLDRHGEWYRYHHLFRDMLLAELHRQEPGLIPVLQRRAAKWCLQNQLPEQALEYSIAAGDTGTVADLVAALAMPAYRHGRVATVQRWFRWLEDRGAIEEHPMVAVLASLLSALTAQPVDAERWADVADRWQYGYTVRPDDPSTVAWATIVRAVLCRHGVEQMRADADEAARMFAAGNFVSPTPVLAQGLARVLSGDPGGGDVCLEDAISLGEEVGSPDDVVIALCERSLVAMARGDWGQAEAFAGQARAVSSRARLEESYFTPLVCAVQARTTMRRGDVAAVHAELVTAQRLRPLLTYALPHLAVQARIELARVYLALADLTGARTLMREVDGLLRHRPDLGILVDEAAELRSQLAQQRGPTAIGASSLTAAELRLLPLLSTHLSLPEIGRELFVSHNTIKSRVTSIYRKLGASSRDQAVTRSRQLGLLQR